MDRQAFVGALQSYIENKILEGDAEDLDENTPLLELGILDSFAIVEVLSFIESDFGVKIGLPAVVPEQFSSISSIADFVMSQAGPDGAQA